MECVATKKALLGLVGLGYIGKVHLRHCLNLESAKLMAVSDLSRKALSFAKKMGVKDTYADYHQLLKDSNIDAVLIALPTHLHTHCAKSVAEAGKDIFVEKPLARNVREGKEIVSIAERNGVKLMVGYDMRFSPPFRSLRKKIQNGVCGDVQIAYGTNIGAGPFFHRVELGIPRPVPDWWFQKELTGGGALMDLGCHIINLFRWYFGEATSIKSYLGYRYDLDIEDHATCIAKFESGTVGVINVGWFSEEGQKKVELLGTVKHAVACRTPQNRILAAIQLLATNSTQYESAFSTELQHFVHCVRHDLQPSTSGDDALKDLETISLAYKNQIVLK
jgi:myo-inositol 2-dehydrogenase/D-chiro-inositol 1-dehydrogenase